MLEMGDILMFAKSHNIPFIKWKSKKLFRDITPERAFEIVIGTLLLIIISTMVMHTPDYITCAFCICEIFVVAIAILCLMDRIFTE